MKKSTTKILLAALSLVMALGIATGSTFAWFTSNRTVTVGAIDTDIVTGNQGLYIAVKTAAGTYGEFKTGLTGSDVTAAIFSGTGSTKLDALTSTDNGVTLTDEEGTAAAAFDGTSETNKYLEFTLKFRTTTAQDIYLGYDGDSVNSTITPGTPAAALFPVLAWKNITQDEYGTHDAIAKGGVLNARAAHATRVAFITGTTPSGVVWAPYDYASGSDDGYNEQAGFYKENLGRDYRNNLLGLNQTYTTANKNAVKLLSDANAAAGTATGATKIVSTVDTAGNGYYEAEVTIRMWIEGTDGDCLNSIFGDRVTLYLVFNSVATPTSP